MLTFMIALRSLRRRKGRMILIGSLVVLGTVIIVFGTTFSQSAKVFSKASIIENFTGDFILYSQRSRELPSPFAFQTPLPLIEKADQVEAWLAKQPQVASFSSIAQNYGLISLQKDGISYELPFIFYAVQAEAYRAMLGKVKMSSGTWFGEGSAQVQPGILISEYQNQQYKQKYGVTIAAGDKVTLLSLTGGGSVNALPSDVVGIFDPQFYKNVFNYINFMDIGTYAQLFNFTGVTALPENFNQALAASSDDDIFALADDDMLGSLNTDLLEKAELTGYTMIAVRLAQGVSTEAFAQTLAAAGFPIKLARWDEASGFFASVADILQGVILGATLLIFLIVVFILMNTQIINVLERTGEVGTYRAIGADKSFVRSLFLWESVILNVGAASIGMIISLVLIISFSGGISLPEIMSQYLVGGGQLRLQLSIMPFVLGLALVLLVSLLATLYPIRVATKVSPLAAMSAK